MNFYIDFLSKQVPQTIEHEWMTNEQKTLVGLINSFNLVCGDLQNMAAGENSSAVIADITDIQNRLINIENYLDYIAKVSTRLLSRIDRQAYNYYTAPVYDEFKNVYDNEYTITQPVNQDDLLRIDKQGQIWIDGNVETSAAVIGNKIKALAETFTENTYIKDMNDVI